MAAQNLLQPVLISVFAVLFGDYFVALFPALEGYKTLDGGYGLLYFCRYAKH